METEEKWMDAHTVDREKTIGNIIEYIKILNE
jgi:hypothetical protein